MVDMRTSVVVAGTLALLSACAHGGGAGSGGGEPTVDEVVGRAAKESRPIVMIFHADW